MSKVKFLNLLFDEGQKTCFTKHAKGTKVMSYPPKSAVFFCINALHPAEDLAPSLSYHSPHVPRRADANVICFRNFLIEIDDMPLDKQIPYVKGLLPVSSVVYSGKKSYHFIISLREPCEDYNEYMQISEALHKHLPKSDSATKNPSRLSRLPNVMRPDTGKSQNLVYLGQRISKQELLDILPKVRYNQYTEVQGGSSSSRSYIDSEVRASMEHPEKYVDRFGGRNQYFFWLGNRLREVANADSNFILERVNKAYSNLKNKNGFPIREAYHAARIRNVY